MSQNEYPPEVNDAIDRADQVLADAQSDYGFDTVLASVSGGSDSMIAMEVAYRSDAIDLDGILYIDTGISVSENREFLQTVADKRDLDLHIVDDEYRRPHEEYRSLVQVYGFPGSKVHSEMWKNLKDKPANRYIKELDGEVGLISGVNIYESDNRMEEIDDDPITERPNWTYVSPIYDWLPSTLQTYEEEVDIEKNEVTDILRGSSGDCLCAAHGSRKELQEIKVFYPELFKEINELEYLVAKQAQLGKIPEEYALWGHSRTGEEQIDAISDPEQPMLMCSGCESDGCDINPTEELYDKTGETLMSKGERFLANPDPIAAPPNELYCPECDAIVENGQEHREKYHPDQGPGRADPGIRMIPRRCGDIGYTRITEGEQTTKNPQGGTCPRREHEWNTDYESPNDIVEAHCEDCGAFKVETTPPDPDNTDYWVSIPTAEYKFRCSPGPGNTDDDDDNDNTPDTNADTDATTETNTQAGEHTNNPTRPPTTQIDLSGNKTES